MESQYQPATLRSFSLAEVMTNLSKMNRQLREKIMDHQGLLIKPIKEEIMALLELTGHYHVISVTSGLERSDGHKPTVSDWNEAFYMLSKISPNDKLDIILDMLDDPHFCCYALSTDDEGVHVETSFTTNFEEEEPYDKSSEIKFKQSLINGDTVNVIKWFAIKPSKHEMVKNWSFSKHSFHVMNDVRIGHILIWKKNLFLHNSCTDHNYDITISWQCKALKVKDTPQFWV